MHALEIGFHRHFPMVAFREDIRQPDHCRPPPTDSPLPPMAGDMPVQDLRQAHLDHLPNEQSHIVDPLGNNHQIALPKDLPGLFRELHSHGPLLSYAGVTWKRAEQLHVMGSKDSRPKAHAPRKLSFWTFCTANGEVAITSLVPVSSTRRLCDPSLATKRRVPSGFAQIPLGRCAWNGPTSICSMIRACCTSVVSTTILFAPLTVT